MSAQMLRTIAGLSLSLALAGVFLELSPRALWDRSPCSCALAAEPEQAFESTIQSKIPSVLEFQVIREEAARLGVRAWLFGGTASAFGHYVMADVRRQQGKGAYLADHFDYDYTHIFRSTQDFDLVIDGDAAKAQEMKAALLERLPHLKASKDIWDVRTLRVPSGQNMALLNNADYLDQNNDSNSTGMIELTEPSKGESIVRDLKSWDAKESQFVKDIREGKITYYHSLSHAETSRFKSGLNPEILSVIRYFTKIFQYDLEPRPEDLKTVQKIIDQFDPASINNDYLQNWIRKNGSKLMSNAVNMERAWNMLEKTGLRKKLIQAGGDLRQVGSLAWWMNKEPLRSKPVGLGDGETAGELGLHDLAHDTSNFAAYESILMSKQGEPNFLISRNQAAGEAAAYGDGLYTAPGKVGARGGNFTIRLKLDPKARENTDFRRVSTGVLILNKNAIRVVSEELNFTPVTWFEKLSEGFTIGPGDQGTYERFKRRIRSRAASLSDEDDRKIAKIIEKELEKPLPSPLLMQAWGDLPRPLRSLHISPEQKLLVMIALIGYDDSNEIESSLKSISSFYLQLPSDKKKEFAQRMKLKAMNMPKGSEKLLNAVLGLDRTLKFWSARDWWEIFSSPALKALSNDDYSHLIKPYLEIFNEHLKDVPIAERVELYAGLPPPLLAQTFSGSKPEPELWHRLIAKADQAQLKEIYRTIFWRDGFGKSPLYSDLKREYLVPIVQRAYELKSPDVIDAVAYHFRESWTDGWGDTLNAVIDEMAKNHDKATLNKTADLLGIFDQPVVGKLEPQVIHLIEKAAEIKNKETLKTIGQKMFQFKDRDPERDFGRALSTLIEKAVELRDVSTLKEIAGNAFTHKKALDWKKQLDALLNAAETLPARGIYAELARHLHTTQYTKDKNGDFEAEMRKLLEIARKSKDHETLSAMVSNLKDKIYDSDFVPSLLDAVHETHDLKTLQWIPSNLFSGYSAEEGKSAKDLEKFMDIATDLHDAKAIQNVITSTIQDKPWSFKSKYVKSVHQGFEKIFQLGESGSAKDREFVEKLMNDVQKSGRSPWDKYAPEGSEDGSLIKELEQRVYSYKGAAASGGAHCIQTQLIKALE
jgi:hypothetical protein